MRLPKHACLPTLRMAIAKGIVIRFWWRGQEIELEPHALLHAPATRAIVMAGWRDGWQFFRFAEMRGLLLTDIRCIYREDTPKKVPLVTRPGSQACVAGGS